MAIHAEFEINANRRHPVTLNVMHQESDKTWPFDQSENTAAFCLESIMTEGAPILLVCHDADDHSWQFLDGEPVDMANALLVSMASVVSIDPSLKEIADLPPGWQASRLSKSSAWVRGPGIA